MYVKNNTINSGGGGTLTVTTLWTNSSPSTSMSITDVPLSQSMTNIDYIRITFFRITTQTETTHTITVPVSQLVDSSASTVRFNLVYYTAARMFYKHDSNSSIRFYNGTSGDSGNSNVCIPTLIEGLKYG